MASAISSSRLSRRVGFDTIITKMWHNLPNAFTGTCEWKIEAFSTIKNSNVNPFLSENFYLGPNQEIKCQMELKKSTETKGSCQYISVFLKINSKDKNGFLMKYVISLLNEHDEEIVSKSCQVKHLKGFNNYGLPQYYQLSKVFDRRNELLLGDALKVKCEVFAAIDENSMSFITDHDIDRVNLCKNIEIIIEKTKSSDMVLAVGDKELYVHKAILADRSPVFKAMFEVEMVEKTQNRVIIEDFEFDSVKAMVSFIYSDKLPAIGEEILKDVLAVAAKYQVDGLKDVCERRYMWNLSLQNLTDTLLLADLYNCQNLYQFCLDFILNNFGEIVVNEDWNAKCFKLPIFFRNLISVLLERKSFDETHCAIMH